MSHKVFAQYAEEQLKSKADLTNRLTRSAAFEKIKEDLRRIKMNESYSPRRIVDLEELRFFMTFDLLLDAISKGLIIPTIPNHKLWEIFKYVVPRSSRVYNGFLGLLPTMIGAISTMVGLWLGYYWLMASIPLVFISKYLSGIVASSLYNLILVVTLSLLFYNGQITIAILCSVHLLTLILSNMVRNDRRYSMITSALSDEEIFSFLFYSNVLSLFNVPQNEFIQHSTGSN